MLASFRKTLTPLPTHPLYLFTIALALGIAWQASTISLYIPAGIGLIGLILLFTKLKDNNYKTILLAATALFFIGALRCQQRVENLNSFYRTIGRRPVRLVARVIDCEPSYRQEGMSVATLEIENIEYLGYKKNTHAHLNPSTSSGRADQKKISYTNSGISGQRVIANISGTPPFAVGDTVSLNRIFFFPPADKSDYSRYLIKSGLVGHLRTRPESCSVLAHPEKSFYRTIAKLRNGTLESAKKDLSPQAFSLFTSIFWGKHAVDQRQINAIREQFRPWGILHYLARAGLHVTMLIILLEKAISFLPLPFMVRTVLGGALIGCYALITWSSISFVRALLVFFIFMLSTLLWLPSQGLYRLALACFLILLVNPAQLFFLDFQLSFLVTAVFMWMSAITKAQNS